jgi:hypothetical protein
MNAHLRKIHHKPFDAMFPANLRMSAFRVCGNSLLRCDPVTSYFLLHPLKSRAERFSMLLDLCYTLLISVMRVCLFERNTYRAFFVCFFFSCYLDSLVTALSIQMMKSSTFDAYLYGRCRNRSVLNERGVGKRLRLPDEGWGERRLPRPIDVVSHSTRHHSAGCRRPCSPCRHG